MRWLARSSSGILALGFGAAFSVAHAGACQPGSYVAGQKPKLGQPVTGGELSKAFGWQYNQLLNTPDFHNGVDFDVPVSQPVLAALDGEVSAVGMEGRLGNVVLIDHGNGLKTGYAHMSQVKAAKGDCVRAGQEIALTGCTGLCSQPHLHFSILLGGEYVDPGPLLDLYQSSGPNPNKP